MGRAIAHGVNHEGGYSDPTALLMLSEEDRKRVEHIHANVPPNGLREGVMRGYRVRQSKMMVARTVAVDEALRAKPTPQVVILGAGLDGRAWRMPELMNAVVFEVDHPDSQRTKHARVEKLSPVARDIRFVAVDFERDSLEQALAKAGHDPSRPTTWIWEGVVMYLALADIESTLAVVQRRSSTGSRLIIVYHSPAFILRLVGFVVSRIGEPLRTALKPEAMRALLDRYGFGVVRDEGCPEVGLRLSPELAEATKVVKHMRVVTADRRND